MAQRAAAAVLCGFASQWRETMRRAMTINEFTGAYGISRATFYRLQETGDGPQTMRVGRRVLIPMEAIEAWEAVHRSGPCGQRR